MAKIARRKVKRNIHIAGTETAGERQQRTAVRFIMDNRFYPSILTAIRAGTPNSKIAEAGILRGWFNVNQKTVVSYLQYFRSAQPNLCKPIRRGDDEDGGGELNIDNIFDGNVGIVDEETELIRLINLQKARLGIAFRNERQINILMASNRREVEELRNLIVDLAKLRGLMGNSMEVNINGYNSTVKDDLKNIQQDEQQRNMIATLVHDLVGVTNGG